MNFHKSLIHYDEKNSNISFLHCVVLHSCYSVFKLKFFITEAMLNEKISFRHNNDTHTFNALQLALYWCFQSKDVYDSLEMISELAVLYRKHELLENSLSEKISSLNEQNIFQYVFPNNERLLDNIIAWPELPINDPFPASHIKYPEWLPIHVAIIKAFIKRNYLNVFLSRKDIDMSQPFPANGIPHYLKGLYPLSAIFYSGNPLKNSLLNHMILAKYAESLLQSLLSNSISNTKKKKIMTCLLYTSDAADE